MFRNFISSEEGQTATEYMLIISVIVIAVVAAAYVFVPTFQKGVKSLGEQVGSMLSSGEIKSGTGFKRGGGGGP